MLCISCGCCVFVAVYLLLSICCSVFVVIVVVVVVVVVVKYPLFSHTYSVILCTLHVILPSTLMYFGSSHGSLW